MKMPFGKYKHVSIELVPSWYFKWLLNQDFFVMTDKFIDLLLAIEAEMKIRDMNGSHFDDDKIDLGRR